MPDHQAIEAVGLEKSYGAVKVLDGVDLTVPAGTVFSLLGPNGAGKTTTVRILATLTALDGGRARVAGYDVVRQRRDVRRMIPQVQRQRRRARLDRPQDEHIGKRPANGRDPSIDQLQRLHRKIGLAPDSFSRHSLAFLR